MIVSEATYETTNPTADSQIVKLKTSGANIFVDIAASKFAAQSIRKLAEMNWKPVHLISSVAGSIGATLKPAGLDNSIGVLSTAYTKDATDPTWKDDPKIKKWNAFMDKYLPNADREDNGYISGVMAAQTLVEVLR